MQSSNSVEKMKKVNKSFDNDPNEVYYSRKANKKNKKLVRAEERKAKQSLAF